MFGAISPCISHTQHYPIEDYVNTGVSHLHAAVKKLLKTNIKPVAFLEWMLEMLGEAHMYTLRQDDRDNNLVFYYTAFIHRVNIPWLDSSTNISENITNGLVSLYQVGHYKSYEDFIRSTLDILSDSRNDRSEAFFWFKILNSGLLFLHFLAANCKRCSGSNRSIHEVA